MNEERAKAYLEAKGRKRPFCPFCQGENCESVEVTITTSGDAEADMICLDCDESWIDIYTLSGVDLE